MTDYKAPLAKEFVFPVEPVATPGNDLETVGFVAPFAGNISEVTYTPIAARAGADTNSRTLQVFNRGSDGLGTTKVAELALVAGVDLVAFDEKAITLQAAANLAVAIDEVITWKSLHVLTGIVDPGGTVKIVLTRS